MGFTLYSCIHVFPVFVFAFSFTFLYLWLRLCHYLLRNYQGLTTLSHLVIWRAHFHLGFRWVFLSLIILNTAFIFTSWRIIFPLILLLDIPFGNRVGVINFDPVPLASDGTIYKFVSPAVLAFSVCHQIYKSWLQFSSFTSYTDELSSLQCRCLFLFSSFGLCTGCMIAVPFLCTCVWWRLDLWYPVDALSADNVAATLH